ncbi:uncharacterized protein LOC101850036 [Aplysia californica]|uniref:Uncharacterized protein LOC101850036 n=1 Tax=Aplysia californica TaxID=6500 RepID=A0ABM1AA41_APLCA|nr:uncharacterized protein LOC101850036 [Aplysia californica]
MFQTQRDITMNVTDTTAANNVTDTPTYVTTTGGTGPGQSTGEPIDTTSQESDDEGIFIGASVGGAVFIAVIIVVIVLLVRRKRKRYRAKRKSVAVLPNPYTHISIQHLDETEPTTSGQWANGGAHVTSPSRNQSDGHISLNGSVVSWERDENDESEGEEMEGRKKEKKDYVNFVHKLSSQLETVGEEEGGMYSDPTYLPSLIGKSGSIQQLSTKGIERARFDSMMYLQPVTNNGGSKSGKVACPPRRVPKARSESNVSAGGSSISSVTSPLTGVSNLKWQMTLPITHRATSEDDDGAKGEEESDIYIDMNKTSPQKRISLIPSPTIHDEMDNNDDKELNDLPSAPPPPPCGVSKKGYINFRRKNEPQRKISQPVSALYVNTPKRLNSEPSSSTAGEDLEKGTGDMQNSSEPNDGEGGIYQNPDEATSGFKTRSISLQQGSVKYMNHNMLNLKGEDCVKSTDEERDTLNSDNVFATLDSTSPTDMEEQGGVYQNFSVLGSESLTSQSHDIPKQTQPNCNNLLTSTFKCVPQHDDLNVINNTTRQYSEDLNIGGKTRNDSKDINAKSKTLQNTETESGKSPKQIKTLPRSPRAKTTTGHARQIQRKQSSPNITENGIQQTGTPRLGRKNSEDVASVQTDTEESEVDRNKLNKTKHKRELAPKVALVPMTKPKPPTKPKPQLPNQQIHSKGGKLSSSPSDASLTSESNNSAATGIEADYVNAADVTPHTQNIQSKPNKLTASTNSGQNSSPSRSPRVATREAARKGKGSTTKDLNTSTSSIDSNETQQSALSRARKMAAFDSNSHVNTVGTLDMGELQRALKSTAKK